MLPPQLQHGLRRQSMSTTAPAATLRSSASPIVRATQSRGCWWGRPRDYPSRVDPMFHRFARYRTLKTRAKLLDKLRRRGRWDWDANQQPFFNPKHVRLASHINRPRWRPAPNEDGKENKASEEAVDEDGFELSRREKEWKDQMEAMRKRIEQDPYEAVFGKRFEPFWSPLVPTWVREELGLVHARKSNNLSNGNSAAASSPPKASSSDEKSQPVNPVDRTQREHSRKDTEPDSESPNGQLTSYSYTPKKPAVNGDPESPNGQLTNYSYAASTSTVWDSWTKKTRRTEWDSISGKARRYEYDPISNRMVEINQPTGAEAPKTKPIEAAKPSTMSGAGIKSKQPHVKSNGFVESTASEVADWTVKSSVEPRKSIPIPTQTIEPTPKAKTSVYFPSLLNTSVVSNAAKKPAALAPVPEKEIDKLTADDVRLSVGKSKEARKTATPLQAHQDETRAHRNGKMDPTKSQWDQAETQMMLNQQIDGLTQKRDRLIQQENQFAQEDSLRQALLKTNDRLLEAKKQLIEMDQSETKARGTVGQMVDYTREKTINRFWRERFQRLATMELETALDRTTSALPKTPSRSVNEAKPATSSSLQPSVERMQSKELPIAVEPDDSAAHESTGDRVDYSAANVPRQWEKQADMLQADRVKRTRDTVSDHTPAIDGWTQHQTLHLDKLKQKHSADKPRWTDVLNARRAKYEAEKAEKKVEPNAAARKERLAKANALLEAEVNDQKMRMQAHEGQVTDKVTPRAGVSSSEGASREAADFDVERARYKEKIRDLRKELDTTFKQSSVNAEMQLDRIRDLANGGSRETAEYEVERERYKQKIRDLRKELDTAFKQSSVNAEMQVERIRDLEKEMEALRKSNIASVRFEEERFQQKINVLKADINSTYRPYVEKSKKQALQIQELEKKLKEADSGIKSATSGPEISQAEGDFCANVTKYAKDNSKWYKKPCHNPGATGKPTEQEINAAAQKVKNREDGLTREVKDIYESRYGKIDADHRQPAEYSYKLPRMSQAEPEVVEAGSHAEVDRALSDYEKKNSYNFEKDSLAAEIAAQEKEAHEAQHLMEPESSSKMKQVIADNLAQDVYGARIVDDKLPKLIPTEIAGQAAESAVDEWGIQWEEPPVYKVLAYDSGNDIIKTAVTSSNFTDKETPISIQEALSELYQPARFVPHFAELQKEGYQVIYGTKDLLVFKKVKSTAEEASTAEPVEEPSLQDHGLFKEVGAKSAGRNPIDGMSHPIEPSTGSFASPTGFVGDRWFSEGQAQSPSTVSKATESNWRSYKTQPVDEIEDDADVKHYPRVKREERVYSGSRLTKKQRKQAEKEFRAAQEGRASASAAKWVLMVCLGVSTAAYSIGYAVEKQDQVRRKERWEEILEGRTR